MPTSLAPSDEPVDRLRSGAAAGMRELSEYKRLLRDLARSSPSAVMTAVRNRQ